MRGFLLDVEKYFISKKYFIALKFDKLQFLYTILIVTMRFTLFMSKVYDISSIKTSNTIDTLPAMEDHNASSVCMSMNHARRQYLYQRDPDPI